MKDKAFLMDILSGKRVLYITTKNNDYVRVSQEIEIIQQVAKKVVCVAYLDRSYFCRILKVYYSLFKLILFQEFDVIFVGFAPQLLLPFLWVKFLNKKCIVVSDFFISIYDTFICDRKKFSPNGIVAKIMRFVDVSTIRHSNYIVADTMAHGAFFSDQFNAKRDCLIILYVKADTSMYHPMELEKPKCYKGKFVVLNFSSMLPVHGTEIIMESAALLGNSRGILFILIGPISKSLKCQYSHLTNIEYINWLTQTELAKYIAISDLCLGGHFSNKVEKAKRTIAGKSFIFKAMNKPVVFGETSANRELFSEEGEGNYFVPVGDAQALARCIETVQKRNMVVNNGNP